MCGIIFIMSNIYTSSWALQLGNIFPLCSTLCVEMQGKNDPMMNTSRATYTFTYWLPENIETRLNGLRSPLYLSNAALLWQCSWLDHQDWLSVKGSTLSVSPQDNILEASCNWLIISELDYEEGCATLWCFFWIMLNSKYSQSCNFSRMLLKAQDLSHPFFYRWLLGQSKEITL